MRVLHRPSSKGAVCALPVAGPHGRKLGHSFSEGGSGHRENSCFAGITDYSVACVMD